MERLGFSWQIRTHKQVGIGMTVKWGTELLAVSLEEEEASNFKAIYPGWSWLQKKKLAENSPTILEEINKHLKNQKVSEIYSQAEQL